MWINHAIQATTSIPSPDQIIYTIGDFFKGITPAFHEGVKITQITM